jgi:ribose transport system ATP-binding protein
MKVGSDADYILEFKGIGKYFPGVQALKDVSFTVRKGEILALLGENGAGKSTLMKILAGAYIKDEGEIYIDGKPADITCPEDSERLGVAIIYQEFNLVPGLTVAENIFMRRQPKKNGMIDWKRMNQMAQAIIDEIDINIRPTDIVNTLTVAEQQMVEICKAVSLNSKILIMDEPTSALTESETQKLFNVVRIKKM